MPTRRQFIKRSAGMMTVSLIMPRLLLGGARPRVTTPDPNRKILLVIQFLGGNDGLNTVVPYADARYHSLRPTLGLAEADLKDDQGRSTIISDELGLHPSLGKIKELYDQNKVAIVLGVGYPNPSDSHFTSSDIWHTANLEARGQGWLGRYADLALVGHGELPLVSSTDLLPRSINANQVVPVNLNSSSVSKYAFQTDPQLTAGRAGQVALLNANNSRSFPDGSYLDLIGKVGISAMRDADQVKQAVDNYHSPVTYPPNFYAANLQLLVKLIASVPEVSVLYVTFTGFDLHAKQADDHARLLTLFSDNVRAFYDDLTAQGLADNVVILQWSEFGRRTAENGSKGTDHGAASSIFVIGNPVRGGLYGEQPSLAAADLDDVGNLKFNVDFRSVYATILDKWLGTDSQAVLGSRYENLGFLG
jgi:uncharacterized protein (DUF1501 family)